MNRYLKLVNFELGRFIKVYLVLIVITIIVQVTGIIVKANEYLAQADKAIYEDLMPQSQFIEQYGQMSFLNFARSLWFMGPIALCAAALAFYIFLIWYRDWFGKNTFIYRLLMLPTARINVFFAKATSIFLMVLGLVSVQLILLPLESTILKWVVPTDFRVDLALSEIIKFDYLAILVPQSFIEFILYYGAGFMVVSVLFTAILFERSYKWKGILMGIGYTLLSIVIFAMPVLLMIVFNQDYLYPLEMLAVETFLGIVVLAASIWMSDFLLKKKVTV
ncbi:hypothetical protein SAMN05216232_3193 [Virgibacillus subterraneus]|uniref:ABC transporter permease n=1 Tax=Virgibacillus subterraneus TaxID=621109 RepID=A0A1H9IFU0_9BACI|nr:hypothetical protein [Virgibacillus subterraneus]SEQ73591.1 hypothetical protein SAMN05216232_3193 [Virgibacillus subterraneus]